MLVIISRRIQGCRRHRAAEGLAMGRRVKGGVVSIMRNIMRLRRAALGRMGRLSGKRQGEAKGLMVVVMVLFPLGRIGFFFLIEDVCFRLFVIIL
ncbi:hypothetical protein PHJA_001186300 [Phtheirospermum japonicum]|uniref:Uncharacterized protein n=1 Tax=Phtheirospermum japonicum TaxID=374723 RepID=A0A830C283_9LAMI|nr:hypothetical protein PHJA_001186300 [Phtheirospermum japonicum]